MMSVVICQGKVLGERNGSLWYQNNKSSASCQWVSWIAVEIRSDDLCENRVIENQVVWCRNQDRKRNGTTCSSHNSSVCSIASRQVAAEHKIRLPDKDCVWSNWRTLRARRCPSDYHITGTNLSSWNVWLCWYSCTKKWPSLWESTVSIRI